MTNAEALYQDIIHLERPVNREVLRRHPRMSLEMRAKIFSPFAALRGLEDCLAAEGGKLHRQVRQVLNEEEAQHLSDQLNHLRKGMEIVVTCFVADEPSGDLGQYKTITGRVVALEAPLRLLRLQCGEERNLKSVTTTLRLDDIAAIHGDGLPDPPYNEEEL